MPTPTWQVVIDPPFITREVWEKYAAAARLLLRPGGPARPVKVFPPKSHHWNILVLPLKCSLHWPLVSIETGQTRQGQTLSYSKLPLGANGM